MRAELGYRPYRHGDAKAFLPRADFAAEHAALGWPLRREPAGVRHPYRWTLTREGSPVGVGGFAPAQEEGRWDAWAFLSDLSPRELAAAVRFAKSMIAVFDRFQGAPLDASASPAAPGAATVLQRHLGFRPVRALASRAGLPSHLLFTRDGAG